LRVILSIAGSDSSGGAGIQADLKAIAACGGYGATVITAITAQNTRGVRAAQELATDLIEAQLRAVFEDLPVAAVKTGMLSSAAVVGTVARELRRIGPLPFVLDPVMIAKSGHALLAADAVDTLRSELLPLATLVTPNRHEAEALAGIPVRDAEGAAAAGRILLDGGCKAVLVKGGHLEGPTAMDVLITPEAVEVFEGPRLQTRHTHGTGCTLAAAIATYLGKGYDLVGAVRVAKRFVTEAIRGGIAIGSGQGPTDPFFYLRGGNTDSWVRELGWHDPELPAREVKEQ